MSLMQQTLSRTAITFWSRNKGIIIPIWISGGADVLRIAIVRTMYVNTWYVCSPTSRQAWNVADLSTA